MKDSLPAPKDPEAAKALLAAAIAGDAAAARGLHGAGGNIGYTKDDVVLDPALDISKASLALFRLLNLHGAGERLNAALYLAAFHGNESVVGVFLEAGAYDRRSLDIALFAATQAGRLPLVLLLEQAGADAAFDGGICLAESIRGGHEAITAHYLESGKGWNQAMVAYIETAQPDKAFSAIGEDIRPLDGLRAISRALSGRRAIRGDTKAATPDSYLDLFDNLLSYAEGLGMDMPALLEDAASDALEQAAPAALMRLVARDDFPALPRKQEILDAALAQLATPALQGGPMGRDTLDDLALLLLEKGGSPGKALASAVALSDLQLVMEAIRRGADPRRDGGAALTAAKDIVAAGIGMPLDDRIDVYQFLKEAAAHLDAADFAAFTRAVHGDLAPGMLRGADAATGRSGLMLAIAAGKAEEAIAAFYGAGLRLGDLLQKAPDGLDAFTLLADKKQEELLLDRRLWSLNENEYHAIFSRLPAARQDDLAAAHAETSAALSADRANWQLRQNLDQARNRFRPR